jgi:hypothetical protein
MEDRKINQAIQVFFPELLLVPQHEVLAVHGDCVAET